MRNETRNKIQDSLQNESSYHNHYNKHLLDTQDEDYSYSNYNTHYINTEDGINL